MNYSCCGWNSCCCLNSCCCGGWTYSYYFGGGWWCYFFWVGSTGAYFLILSLFMIWCKNPKTTFYFFSTINSGEILTVAIPNYWAPLITKLQLAILWKMVALEVLMFSNAIGPGCFGDTLLSRTAKITPSCRASNKLPWLSGSLSETEESP